MIDLKIAKQVSDLVKEIEILDNKMESLTAFAGRLVASPHGNVEMSLEEFDFKHPPLLQFMPAQDTKPGDEPRMVGYSKVFEGPGDLNIYSVLIENKVAMSVIDTVIGKMKAQRIAMQSQLGGLMPGEKSYNYTLQYKP